MASLNYKSGNEWKKVSGGKTGVLTFKGRAGVVTPKEGDYTAEMVGARPNTWMPNIAEVGGVNPNLLHNWYFANPVNQRGQTEYTEEGYTIDRWKKTSSPVISLTDNGLRLRSSADYHYITQLIEKNLNGRSVTLSALFSDGTLLWGSKNVDENTDEVFAKNGWHFSVYLTGGDTCIRILNSSSSADITIVAIKLELGSTQTLAHQDADGNWVLNEIPDYGEELRKCQRYCYVLNTEKNPYIVFGMGVAANNTDANIVVPLPVKMRAYPNISMHGSLALFINGGWEPIEVTSIALERGAMQGVVQLRASGTGLTVGEIYEFAANTDANAKLIFDANL